MPARHKTEPPSGWLRTATILPELPIFVNQLSSTEARETTERPGLSTRPLNPWFCGDTDSSQVPQFQGWTIFFRIGPLSSRNSLKVFSVFARVAM